MPEPPRANLSANKGLGPEEISNHTFATVKKGLDPSAVRRFLGELGSSVREARAREASLQMLLDMAEERASSPNLDEATLAAAVGAETARILQVAHEAAHAVLERAQSEASSLVAEAESTLSERLRASEEEARSIATRAHAEANVIADAARRESQEMLDEALDARRRVLADLADRRRLLHAQLEQLRAGKDTLVEVVDAVANSVSAVRNRLDNAEDEARAAAGEALRNGTMLLGNDDALSNEVSSTSAEGDENASIVLGEDASASDDAGDEADGPIVPDDGVVASKDAIDAPGTAFGIPEDDEKSRHDGETAERIDVDELFARIRTTSLRQEGTSIPLSGEGLLSSDDDFGLEDQAELRASQAQRAEPAIDVMNVASAGTSRDAHGLLVAGVETQGEDVERPLGPPGDEELRARRDTLLDPIVASLSSVLKRALRSEQNELLDSIRHLARNGDPASLLDVGSSERLVEQSSESLAKSFEAGVSFGRFVLGCDDEARAEPPHGEDESVGEKEAVGAGEEIAQGLAQQIIKSVNRRMAEGLSDAAGDPGALASLVGFAYRQWKGSRIEVLAADSAVHAFALGTRAAASTVGATLRWVVDDGEATCPDCDDNALAEPLAVGEEFPTGHANPPVHSGCRCVLVPQDT
jgi:cell division septum initiation protein DivIVA